MPNLASTLMKFAPPAFDDKEQVFCGVEDESTDHGSILSDNDASVDTYVSSEFGERGYEARLASRRDYGAALPGKDQASRRSELRMMGQQVLGNLTMPEGGKKAKAAAVGGRNPAVSKGSRQQQPPLPPPQQPQQQMSFCLPREPGPVCNALSPGLQMPLVPGPQAMKKFPTPPPAQQAEVQLPAAWLNFPTQPPAQQAEVDDAHVPWKVEDCYSFNVPVSLGLPPSSFQDDMEHPWKKRPIFKSGPGVDTVAFDPAHPLKKRVPEALLQDSVCVFNPVISW